MRVHSSRPNPELNLIRDYAGKMDGDHSDNTAWPSVGEVLTLVLDSDLDFWADDPFPEGWCGRLLLQQDERGGHKLIIGNESIPIRPAPGAATTVTVESIGSSTYIVSV